MGQLKVAVGLIAFIALMIFTYVHPAHASGYRTRAEVAAFHARFDIESRRSYQIHLNAATEVKLPTSPGYDQQNSGLCWFYATTSALESNFLVKNPNAKIAFSRSAMQYLNMEDRYQRKFRGIEDNEYEGGTVVDAMALMRNKPGYLHNTGLFAFQDFHPLPANAPMKNPLGTIGPDQLYSALEKMYGLPPTVTHDIQGRNVSPLEFQQEILVNQVWTAYSPANQKHPVGISQHFDPDARKGTMAQYVEPAQFIAVLGTALKRGQAVTVTWPGHEEEIFGADFDASGNPTQIFIKGSYGPNYIHMMSAADAFRNMVGMTTISLSGF